MLARPFRTRPPPSAACVVLAHAAAAAGRGKQRIQQFAEFDVVLSTIQLGAATGAVKSQLQQIDVPGDGNCLFHAVAVSHSVATGHGLLSPTESLRRARELRRIANDYLCPGGAPAAMELNGLPVELVIEPLGGEGGRGYCRRLRQDGQWGGAAEILALSKQLRCPIAVYTRGARRGALDELDVYGREERGGVTVPILYLHGQHYTALGGLQPAADDAAAAVPPPLHTKPTFTAAGSQNQVAANRALKKRMRGSVAFRERGESWDARRLRIEARLGGGGGEEARSGEWRSAARAWLKHVERHPVEREAALTLGWVAGDALERQWDRLVAALAGQQRHSSSRELRARM
jgi:hypothetical protein